ncbi:MAG: AsmA family protein [Rhizobiaceae bacterium]|nr:AsmA family protein [Rhizobiaceae bacterium]
MPARSIKRTAWAVGLATGAMVVVALALPYVASTHVVGDRIADEMAAWSGMDVSIDAAPEISIWPDLKATLTDVTFSLPGGETVATADRVEVDLSALAALRGRIDFSKAVFFSPTVRLDTDGLLPSLPKTGRIARAVAAAKDMVAEGKMPDAGLLPNDNFGTVEFIDGRVVRPLSSLDVPIVTALNGRMNWATLDGRLSATAKGAFKGEEFTIELSSASPLSLLGGAPSAATLALKSEPVKLSFDGTASLGNNPYATGQASFSTPSVRKLLAWSGASIPVGSAIEAFSVESRIMADPARIRFEEASITLDNKPARGVLDLLLNGTTPKVSGTMAFDTLDLGAFLAGFTPFDPLAGDGPGRIDTDFASQLNLDLRLSAAQAVLGNVALTDLAATARVEDDLAAFDISDATVFGGDIQAGLRFDHKTEGAQVEMRLLASNVSGEALGSAANLGDMAPTGKGAISLILKGTGESWKSLLTGASGSFSANFGGGALRGIDLTALLAATKGDTPFPLSQVAAGSSQIEGLDLKAVIAEGTARIEKAEIRSAGQRIGFVGTAPLNGGSLSLSGRVDPLQKANGEAPTEPATATFLIGGPLVSATVTPTTGLSAE